MKPRVAVCLYGMLGRYNDDPNELPKDSKYALKSLFENVLENVDYDIFLHTWSNQHLSKSIEYLKPLKYCITPPINFSHLDQKTLYLSSLNSLKQGIKKFITHLLLITPNGKDQKQKLDNIFRRYYSSSASTLLMKEHVLRSNTKYSHIFVSRLDLEYLSKFNFDELSNQKIYLGGSCELQSKSSAKTKPIRYYHSLKQNNTYNLKRADYPNPANVFEDFWYICNFNNSLIISDIFLKLNDYIKSGTRANSHHLLTRHLRDSFSSEKICLYKNRIFDFDLSRRIRLGDVV